MNTQAPISMTQVTQVTQGPQRGPSYQTQVPQGSYMNSLVSGPRLNTRNNIIAGPSSQDYWFHSPGAEQPEIKEQGPFPIQGNIGSLVAAETTNYNICNTTTPQIGSGPNCSGSFVPDIYTKTNTCGDECMMNYPESYGIKNFGFPNGTPASQKVTNAHQVHAYANIRAAMPGQDMTNGCYEYIPALKSNPSTGTCYINEKEVYQQVGPWDRLPMYSNLINAKFNKGPI